MAGTIVLFVLCLLILPASLGATPILPEEFVSTVGTPAVYGGVSHVETDEGVAQVWNGIREAASTYIVASSAVVTSIPEPGTVSLLALGIAAFGARRARWRPRA